MDESPGRGWIRLHRRIYDHPLWPSRRKFTNLEAWLDLIMMANFRDSKVVNGNDLMVVRRGQILTSQVALARRWRWNRKSVVAFLKLLKSDSQLDYESSSRTDSGFTLITICNYERYQATDEPQLDNQPDSQLDSEGNNRGTAEGQPRGTSEECKEGKEEERPPISPKRGRVSASSNGRKNGHFTAEVTTIIGRINELSGKAYGTDSKEVNKGLVTRLKEGVSVDECLLVINDRWADWKNNPDMKKHFNPETLFRPGKFEKYRVEAEANGKAAEPGFVGQ